MIDQCMKPTQQDQQTGQDTLYLLQRLLSNQHTFTGTEFREELKKIVEAAETKQPQSQRQRQPLTDEQIDAALLVWCGIDIPETQRPLFRDSFRKAIEAAHGIKEIPVRDALREALTETMTLGELTDRIQRGEKWRVATSKNRPRIGCVQHDCDECKANIQYKDLYQQACGQIDALNKALAEML